MRIFKIDNEICNIVCGFNQIGQRVPVPHLISGRKHAGGVRDLFKKRHVLTDVLLETLSIIAYKQPITKVEIEKIRGVSCDHAVNKLVEYNLVCELGRLDAPGRPLLFGTTEEFLRSFGVQSIDELPVLNPVQVEEFKQEAEAEMHMKLDI